MYFKQKRKINEKGQTLLFVVVAITVALAVGISVSTRTLTSSRRVTRTDTASRVAAVAEGGIENLLNQPTSILESLQNPNPDVCTSAGADYDTDEGKCIYNFSGSEFEGTVGSDVVATRAIVSVERFKTNDTNYYWFNIDPGYVKEISLSGYGSTSIRVCWDNPKSAIYFISYNRVGSMNRGGFYSATGFTNTTEVSGFTAVTSSQEGFVGCRNITLVSDPHGLRIKTLYDSTRVGVFPSAGVNLPDQGYKLTSTGELSFESAEKETKTVVVYRSFSYAPSVFDYGIYTTDDLN